MTCRLLFLFPSSRRLVVAPHQSPFLLTRSFFAPPIINSTYYYYYQKVRFYRRWLIKWALNIPCGSPCPFWALTRQKIWHFDYPPRRLSHTSEHKTFPYSLVRRMVVTSL
ncbi:hypothetical protein AGDE_14042 [Angomonas deanei]|nr:hypothetical protein AGDE_14042 [Angomonas deanei]|eukprot:EPY21525.1 hypothetical protein AGDE_14042 [Angomonas deanei]